MESGEKPEKRAGALPPKYRAWTPPPLNVHVHSSAMLSIVCVLASTPRSSTRSNPRRLRKDDAKPT